MSGAVNAVLLHLPKCESYEPVHVLLFWIAPLDHFTIHLSNSPALSMRLREEKYPTIHETTLDIPVGRMG